MRFVVVSDGRRVSAPKDEIPKSLTTFFTSGFFAFRVEGDEEEEELEEEEDEEDEENEEEGEEEERDR